MDRKEKWVLLWTLTGWQGTGRQDKTFERCLCGSSSTVGSITPALLAAHSPAAPEQARHMQLASLGWVLMRCWRDMQLDVHQTLHRACWCLHGAGLTAEHCPTRVTKSQWEMPQDSLQPQHRGQVFPSSTFLNYFQPSFKCRSPTTSPKALFCKSSAFA